MKYLMMRESVIILIRKDCSLGVDLLQLAQENGHELVAHDVRR